MLKKTLPGLILVFFFVSLIGCGYHYFAGDLTPESEIRQLPDMEVRDDGSVAYIHERLEISLRPVTDAELNRRFPEASQQGIKSTNPYTYGNWKDPVTHQTPQRFTVFLLKVKNYTFPKVQIDPAKIKIICQNGRQYSSLSLLELKEYYYPYVSGYSGVASNRFEARKDILRATLYSGDVIFSGQESEGYVVFPKLHYDVKEIAVHVNDVVLRFNVLGEPVETVDLVFRFHRDVYKARQPRS
ncbi:MAG: hypothetical protein J7J76_03635 [Candidatus Latescibacteria bacterium]|nr:hypothetical protein [Candidatus Latescibacterota bacterium]